MNVVAPGAIETDFAGGSVRDNAELNSFIASQTALGRVGLPDDIGEAIPNGQAPLGHRRFALGRKPLGECPEN